MRLNKIWRLTKIILPLHSKTIKNMAEFKLVKENDPRCIEYYIKAFPDLKEEEQEKLRLNWIKNNIKK